MFKKLILVFLFSAFSLSCFQQAYAAAPVQQHSADHFAVVKDAVQKYGNIATVKNILTSDALGWAGVGITSLLYSCLNHRAYTSLGYMYYMPIALPAALACYKMRQAYYADDANKKDSSKPSWQSGVVKGIIGVFGMRAALQGLDLYHRPYTSFSQRCLLAAMGGCAVHSIYKCRQELKKAAQQLETKPSATESFKKQIGVVEHAMNGVIAAAGTALVARSVRWFPQAVKMALKGNCRSLLQYNLPRALVGGVSAYVAGKALYDAYYNKTSVQPKKRSYLYAGLKMGVAIAGLVTAYNACAEFKYYGSQYINAFKQGYKPYQTLTASGCSMLFAQLYLGLGTAYYAAKDACKHLTAKPQTIEVKEV